METLDRILSLHDHCYFLATLIGSEEIAFSRYREGLSIDDEVVTWRDVSALLEVGSSIFSVEVVTGINDPGIFYCDPVDDYHSKKSELLTRLVAPFTIFNFVWGSFETLVKIINPPKVPKKLYHSSSPVDEVIYYLQCNLMQYPSIPYYKEILADLREYINCLPQYRGLLNEFKLKPHMSFNGLGIHVVRKVRNKFAHGIVTVPEPEEIGENDYLDPLLIDLCTRITLMAIQMILMAFFQKEQFTLDFNKDVWGYLPHVERKNIHDLLWTIHLKELPNDVKQLSLF